MNFIKKYSKKRLIHKLKINNDRKKAFHNIEDCKKIAFIVDSDNIEIVEMYNDFLKDLKQQDIQIFELFVTKVKTKKDVILPKNKCSISDKNWIKLDTVKSFISDHYDMLITVFPEMNFNIQYLTAIASADLKVSPSYSEFNTGDVTFHVEGKSFDEYFKAIKQYLSKNK